ESSYRMLLRVLLFQDRFVVAVQPVHLGHLAKDDDLVTIGAYGPVVVEAVGEMGITADHVRGFEHDTCNGVVDAAAAAGNLRAGHVHDAFLGVIHHRHAFGHALRDHGAGDQ